MKRIVILPVVLLIFSIVCTGQSVEVSRSNKTIAVNAEASEMADSDIAVVKFSYQNYGTSTSDAYEGNIRVSAAIVKSMLQAGVPKDLIETSQLQLSPVYEKDEKWTAEERKARQASAEQSWTVRIPGSEAQKLVGVVMKAGANKIHSVEWDLADRASLQAKASGTALAKARAVADQMAKGLNARLGDLVYASNFAPEERERFIEQFWSRRDRNINVITKSGTDETTILLFPQKVKETAKVHAVFAIE